jgi:sensor histidine kinase regulating citrate/malate metabolism
MRNSSHEGKTKEKRTWSLKFQFTLFFILFIVAVYSVVIVTSVQQLVVITETIADNLGVPIVKDAAAVINGDAFEALSASLDPQDPWYERTRLAMLAIKEKSECIYLYTMAPAEGNVFRYIVDGSAPPDDPEHFSPLGTEEDISDYIKPVLQAMEAKDGYVSRLDYSQWGFIVSTYTAILNSSGKAVGVIGCDFRVEDISGHLLTRMIRQLIISAVFTIAGFIAYLYMVNGVSRQNQRLRELKDAAEAASAALKDERDTIAAMKDALKVGLFFMDKNFVIQDQYSKFLETVLGIKGLQGKKFTDLISPGVKKSDITSMIEYFVLLFNRSVVFGRKFTEKMLEDLNPVHELVYITPETGEEKILRCNFVPVDRGQGRLFVLGNIQNVTEEKKMQKRLAELDSLAKAGGQSARN